MAWAGGLGLAAAMGIGRFAFTPMLPPMLAEGDLTLDEGSALALANYLGYFVGALAAALHRADAGRRARVGLLLIALTTFGMGWAQGWAAWWLLRFVSGVASAMVLVGVSAWALPRLAAAGAARLAGRVYAGVGLGIAAAGLLVAAMLALGHASPVIWAWLALASAGVLALAWPLLRQASPPTVPATSAGHSKPGTAPARAWMPPTWVLLLAYAAMGYGYIIPATYLPALAQRHLEPALYPLIWPAFGLAAALSTLLGAAAAARLGPRRLWAWTQLAMAAGVAAPWLAQGAAALAASALLVGGSFMVVTMAAMQLAGARGGGAGLMAAMTASFAIGQLAGPWAVRLFAGAGLGPGPVIVAAAGLLLGAALLRPWRSDG